MFVRSKTMGDATYYQVVHGYRDPQTREVRQRTRISLGRNPTVSDALDAATIGLETFRSKRAKLGDGPFIGRLKRQADHLDRRIDESKKRIVILKGLRDTLSGG